MDSQPLYDLAPLLRMMLLGIAVASGPLAWIWLRNKQAHPGQRLAALGLVHVGEHADVVHSDDHGVRKLGKRVRPPSTNSVWPVM